MVSQLGRGDAGNSSSRFQPTVGADFDSGYDKFLRHSDSQRWRDIFPLPPFAEPGTVSSKLSKTVRQRLNRSNRWTSWANSGIDSLNSMYGFRDVHHVHKAGDALNASQTEALSHIKSSYVEACKGIDEPPAAEESLNALLSTSGLYDSDNSTVVPYSKELCSWPKIGSTPTPLEGILSPADIHYCENGCESLLRSEQASRALQQELNISKPYSDPSLINNPKTYADFLWRLHAAGMLRWTVRGSRNYTVGVFFVRKSNGRIRIIFDTRVANTRFREPPSTRLPTSAAFGSIESDAGENFLCTGDIECAFYNLAIPTSLVHFFALPPMRAHHLGLRTVNGIEVSPSVDILPELLVLPMGWSWALHMCQSVLNNALRISNFSLQSQVVDGSATAHIIQPVGDVCAGYVDNFAVLGSCRKSVQSKRDRICTVLRDQMGLPVHELSDAEPAGTFIGLEFSEGRIFRIKKNRLHRLRSAISCVLRRGRASGDVIRIITGHITFACLIRRESLAFLHAVYAFAQKNIGRVSRLWPSVRRELECISSILPLLHVDICQAWSSHVSASDASLYGLGCCEKLVDPDIVGSIGRCSERWRYTVDAHVRARSSALAGTDPNLPDDPDPDALDKLERGIFEHTRDFAEVPEAVYGPDNWTTFYAARVRGSHGILLLEARALVASIKHQLRRTSNFNKRLLFIVDNLALCLAMCKGRSSAAPLIHALRQIACLFLVSGARGCARWVPSERNFSDKASRGLFGFWSSLPRKYGLPDGSGPPPQQARECGGPTGFSQAVRSGPHSICGLLPDDRADVDGRPVFGPRLDSVFRAPVRGGLQCGAGAQSHVGARPLLAGNSSRGFDMPPKKQTRVDRLAKPASPKHETASASFRSSRDRSEDGLDRSCCHGGVGHAHIRMLHETGGVHAPEGAQLGAARPGLLQRMGVSGERHVLRGGRQDGTIRRIDSHSRRLALSSPGSVQDVPLACRPSVEFLSECPAPGLPCYLRVPGSWGDVLSSVRAETRRSQPRSNDGRLHPDRAAARPLGITKIAPAIRKRDSSFRADGETQPPDVNSCPKSGKRFLPGHPGKFKARHPFSHTDISSAMRAKAQVSENGIKKTGTPISPLVRLLKRDFQAARRSNRNSRTRIILELFSGAGGLSSKLRAKGWGVLALDIKFGEHHNILRPEIFRVICGWISSGAIAAVWLGTPCSTWSAALHGPPDSGWCRLRSAQHIFGLPNLNEQNQIRCRIGNQLMRRSAVVLSKCGSLRIPAFLENPHSSFLWQAPQIRRIMNNEKCSSIVYDACGFGARWRKRTRVLTLHAPNNPSLSRLCRGRRGCCSFSDRPHITLTGKDPISRRLWTKIAEPYPTPMCTAFAQFVSNAIIRSSRSHAAYLASVGNY